MSDAEKHPLEGVRRVRPPAVLRARVLAEVGRTLARRAPGGAPARTFGDELADRLWGHLATRLLLPAALALLLAHLAIDTRSASPWALPPLGPAWQAQSSVTVLHSLDLWPRIEIAVSGDRSLGEEL